MPLTSVHNPVLKRLRAAAAQGRATDDGLVVAEGPHLLREALRSEWTIQQVFCTEAALTKHNGLLQEVRVTVTRVPSRTLQSTASTEASQEILTTLRPRTWAWTDLLGSLPLVVVLDGLQDPGNAGTILRSAEAFGATGVVFLQGSVRVANGKLLRASAGSLFRLPWLETIDPGLFSRMALDVGLAIYSLDMRRSTSLQDVDWRVPCALVVGSEGAGIRPELKDVSVPVSIRTRGVESLNAGVACSLALYEANNRRSRT